MAQQNIARMASLLLLLLTPTLQHSSTCRHWRERYFRSESNCLLNSCCELGSGERLNSTAYKSGEYMIKGDSFSRFNAWCDMETDDGGWLVVLRRQTESDFEKFYDEYEAGFGSLNESFWYGLRAIHALTSQRPHEMRVDMYTGVDDTVSTSHAHYSLFSVSSADTNYTLTLDDFTGSDTSLSDSLMQFNNQPFTAEIRDNVLKDPCIHIYKGGWWYTPECVVGEEGTRGSVLTISPAGRLEWIDIQQNEINHFAKYEMKIRPLDCTNTN